MSSYLSFRKNGVTLTHYSRSTHMYEALSSQAPYAKWRVVTHEDLAYGLAELLDEKKGYEKAIDRQKTVLQYVKQPEEIHGAISTIQGMEDLIEEIDTTIAELRLIMRICETPSWDVIVDNDKCDDELKEETGKGRSIFEWMVD